MRPELITAPFIRRVRHDGREFLQRLDGSRQLVEANSLVIDLLQRFAHPSKEASERGARVGESDQTITQLIHAGLLIEVSHLRVPTPSIELELTNRCNARCIMCPRNGLRPLGSMSNAAFKSVLRFIRLVRPSGLILQGIGEPTLHPRLLQWSADLRAALGAAPLVLVTNGMQLPLERLEGLRAAGLDHVQWSFHSLQEFRYNSIFGVEGYEVARRNLEAAIRAFGSFISVNFVIMDSNEQEIPVMRRWLEELGLPEGALRLVRCQSRGGFIDAASIARGPRTQGAGRCLYVRKTLFIAQSGDLLPCSNDIAGEVVYGNLEHEQPATLLHRWRDDMLSKAPVHRICQGCDHHLRDTLETRWFDEMRGRPLESSDSSQGIDE